MVTEPIPDVAGVSRVVRYIKQLISKSKVLTGMRVRGEISGLREKNGRLYFDLKENTDVLKCMVWAGDATRLPELKNGVEVICAGDFTTYEPHSQYELIVKSVELSGVGALFAQFEALKKAFREEGLFESARKRQITGLPRRVAVVSAGDGKGVEDFFTIIKREAPFVTVVPFETRVQGDGAEMDIAEAIRKASKADVDVIVVTRGGGSYEDLFAFNREPVVRAICASAHPVISAVGHTGDVHLSDLVADVSYETPSAAAHAFGAIGARYDTRIANARYLLDSAVNQLFYTAAQRIDSSSTALESAIDSLMRRRERMLFEYERRLSANTPRDGLAKRRDRLTTADLGLRTAAMRFFERARDRLVKADEMLQRQRLFALRTRAERLGLLTEKLHILDPDRVLERGYAIVTAGGRAITDATAVSAGERIEARLRHGIVAARVEETRPNA